MVLDQCVLHFCRIRSLPKVFSSKKLNIQGPIFRDIIKPCAIFHNKRKAFSVLRMIQ